VAGAEQITIEALRSLANDLDDVRSALKEAAAQVEEAEIGGGAFTFYGLDMAAAYPSAHAFARRDAESKEAHVETIQDRLRSTAKVWEDAEHQSTIANPQG
jgi:hypothetical protein